MDDAVPPAAAPQRRARQPRQATAERRAEILRAAANTFGSKGYKNGSLTEVAEQVGITHAGVLHHFGSKEQLLVEVLEYRDKEDVRDLEGQHIPERHGAVPAPRAHRADERRPPRHRAGLLGAHRRVRHREPPRPRLGHRPLHHPARRDPAAIVEVGGGTVPDDVAACAASAIIGVMDGLQVQWLLDDGVDLPAATQFAIEAILAAALLGAAPAAPAGLTLRHFTGSLQAAARNAVRV